MLRLTDRDRDRREVFTDFILKKIDTYACAENPHDGEGPESNYHYHSIHQNKKSTIKDRIVAKGYTGNQNHAFTHLIEDTDEHWERTLAYISKGPGRGVFPDIVRNDFEFTEERIWELHYLWWDKYKTQKPLQVVKKTARNSFLEMYDAIPLSSKQEGPWKIAEDIIQYYNDLDKLEPNDFQLKCYVKSIIRKFASSLDSKVWERFKRQRAREIVGTEFRYEFFSYNKENGISKSLQEASCIPQETSI